MSLSNFRQAGLISRVLRFASGVARFLGPQQARFFGKKGEPKMSPFYSIFWSFFKKIFLILVHKNYGKTQKRPVCQNLRIFLAREEPQIAQLWRQSTRSGHTVIVSFVVTRYLVNPLILDRQSSIYCLDPSFSCGTRPASSYPPFYHRHRSIARPERVSKITRWNTWKVIKHRISSPIVILNKHKLLPLHL